MKTQLLSTATASLLMTLALTGCGRDVIPNTDVEDTKQNREVIEFVEKYRKAVQQRNVGELMELASERYLDDNGTPVGRDDIDYKRLREKLSKLNQEVKDVRYEIRYRRIIFRGDKVYVDYTYTASFLVQTPEGERWSRRLADNRLELGRRDGEGPYRILSGM